MVDVIIVKRSLDINQATFSAADPLRSAQSSAELVRRLASWRASGRESRS